MKKVLLWNYDCDRSDFGVIGILDSTTEVVGVNVYKAAGPEWWKLPGIVAAADFIDKVDLIIATLSCHAAVAGKPDVIDSKMELEAKTALTDEIEKTLEQIARVRARPVDVLFVAMACVVRKDECVIEIAIPGRRGGTVLDFSDKYKARKFLKAYIGCIDVTDPRSCTPRCESGLVESTERPATNEK